VLPNEYLTSPNSTHTFVYISAMLRVAGMFAVAGRLSRPATRPSEWEGAFGFFRTAASMANLLSIPLGRWPNGTGKLPVPPNFISEFELRNSVQSPLPFIQFLLRAELKLNLAHERFRKAGAIRPPVAGPNGPH
jgi:hypothetical protein